MKPVIQSYKKVLNFGPSSVAATTTVQTLVLGENSVAAGQTGPTDAAVPTGSMVKFIEIQHAMINIGETAPIIHASIQHLHADQSIVAPDGVGTSDKRNQVHFQALYGSSADSNTNHIIRFKIPPRFQRVRDGSSWQYIWKNSNTVTSATQVIYKFYR